MSPVEPRILKGNGRCLVLAVVVAMSLASLSIVAPAAILAAETPSPRPNVVLIMADDLGYETIGANGGTSYRTPVLDKLAAGGVRFDQCYVQPLCTPTRVQLMTGAYNVRNYITFGKMDPELTTFGNLFKTAGYATCITGKWQLGQDPSLPKKYGFDEHCLWQHTRRPPRYANAGLEINGVEKDSSNGEYGPDLVNDEHGLRQNTLLIFLGDNGTGKGTKSMMGDRVVIGGKGATTAAGMHVPCIASWPAVITTGRVCHDLVDSTDFLPTICEAAGVKIPASLTLDGRSVLPQLRGDKGNPREWIYSWYSPRGERLREFAFDQRFKLYRNGEFFDLTADRDEKHPLSVASLKEDAAATAKRLQVALNGFDNARPAKLPRPEASDISTDKPTRKKAKKKAQ